MATFGSAGGAQTLNLVGASAPVVTRIPMPTAGDEYSYALPSNCKQYLIRTLSRAEFDIGYVTGQRLLPVPRCCFLAESALSTDTTTLFFSSATSNEVAIIVTWV